MQVSDLVEIKETFKDGKTDSIKYEVQMEPSLLLDEGNSLFVKVTELKNAKVTIMKS